MAGQRVAVIHEWLVTFGGSEKVLAELLALFPDADLFAVVDFLSSADRLKLQDKQAQTSFIQTLPFAARRYRSYLPFMPLAIEQFDLSGYDLVISSSHAVAKGVLTGPGQIHVCYCHSPMRYAWDLQHQYLRETRLTKGMKSLLARLALHYIRLWDARTAPGVDLFIANSAYIAKRIRKVYRREAAIVHPPVDVEAFPLWREKEDFYLTASRMVPYKRIDIIVDAFAQMPERRLVVIGDGPDRESFRALGRKNIAFLGYQEDLGVAGLSATRTRFRVRRGGGFRNSACRGTGLRNAGDRLWRGRSAGDGAAGGKRAGPARHGGVLCRADPGGNLRGHHPVRVPVIRSATLPQLGGAVQPRRLCRGDTCPAGRAGPGRRGHGSTLRGAFATCVFRLSLAITL